MENRERKAVDNEASVLAVIEAMKEPYRTIGKRLHEIILNAEPNLKPRVWYGMPGYAKSGSAPVLLFFRADVHLMTLGLTEKVRFVIEENAPHQLMACAWYFKDLDKPTEDKITDIVRQSVL